VLDHREPRRVELVGGGGGPPPGDPVGLLDEGGREPERGRNRCRRCEVRGLDAAARTVAEDDGAARFVDGLQVDARGPVRRWHLDPHPVS
jgi:hypothetical protein